MREMTRSHQLISSIDLHGEHVDSVLSCQSEPQYEAVVNDKSVFSFMAWIVSIYPCIDVLDTH